MVKITNNKIVDEIHGCIVCANLFTVLVVCTPEGGLLDCTVTSPGGHIVQKTNHLLVACDSHNETEIEDAYNHTQGVNSKNVDGEQETNWAVITQH